MRPLIISLFIIFLITSCKKQDCPVVTTTEVTSITPSSATLSAKIISYGESEIISKGFLLGETANLLNDTILVEGTEIGDYFCNLTDLIPKQEYYIKAFASNSFGTGFGATVSFTTEQASLPTVTTSQVTSITCTTATSGGEITEEGGVQISDRGICWGTSENPTINDNFISLETEYRLNPFSFIIKNLEPNSLYFVRAYASNIAGIGYGESRQFITNNQDPQFEPNSIIGTWEMYGDNSGHDHILGITHITEFTEDSLVIDRYMGEIILECNFTVSSDTIRYLLGVADPVIYNLNSTFDSLSFYAPSSGIRTYYARLY